MFIVSLCVSYQNELVLPGPLLSVLALYHACTSRVSSLPGCGLWLNFDTDRYTSNGCNITNHSLRKSLSSSLAVWLSSMAAKTTIYWLAPASMIASLVLGLLFASGHHLFYQSLNGTKVSTGPFLGSPISKQAANTAIGTAPAFLVKASLVLAVSSSFVQLFWRTTRVYCACGPPTLAQLDSLYSVLHSIIALLNVALWWRCPLLLLTAAVAWYVSCLWNSDVDRGAKRDDLGWSLLQLSSLQQHSRSKIFQPTRHPVPFSGSQTSMSLIS